MTFLQETFQMPWPFTPPCLIPTDQPSRPLSLHPHLPPTAQAFPPWSPDVALGLPANLCGGSSNDCMEPTSHHMVIIDQVVRCHFIKEGGTSGQLLCNQAHAEGYALQSSHNPGGGVCVLTVPLLQMSKMRCRQAKRSAEKMFFGADSLPWGRGASGSHSQAGLSCRSWGQGTLGLAVRGF